ncbi:MAG: phosphate regulon sensor histidine kinase PhoR [Pseudomonadota bacterium]
MTNRWSTELGRVGLLALLGLGLGLFTPWPLVPVILVVAGYLGWHLYNIARLQRWLYASGQGEPPQAQGIWEDIFNGLYRRQIRQRKRRKRLNRLIHRFEESAAAMPDATIILGERGVIEWWNDAAGRLLGLRHPGDRGQRIHNLVRHPAFTDYLAREDFSDSVEFPSPADARVMLSARVVRYGRDQRLLLARDVTRLHQLEQMRRDFVANVSHELRTPLTVLAGYIETLQDELAAEEEAAPDRTRPLELMEQQTTRMRALVDDLLYLSRLEMDGDRGPAPENIDVPELAETLAEEARQLSGERAHVITVDADPELPLRGVPNELRSAFANLVFNAVQYTPAGGTIRIAWTRRPGGGGCFAVTDTGIGIPARHLARLTERFYRVDVGRSREKGGTGLGLAIVKHILQRHEGWLEVESEAGEGSTFRCCFPAERVDTADRVVTKT